MKIADPKSRTLTPARSPYLMHPDRVSALRNLLIEGELPPYKG